MKPDLTKNEIEIKPDDRIVIVGEIAILAVKEAFEKNKEALINKFNRHIADSIESKQPVCAEDLVELSTKYLAPAGEEGILQALWILSEVAKSGFSIDTRLIPISTAAVEVCEYEGFNPYEADSTGTFVAVTDNSKALIEKLAARGIKAVDVGGFSKNNDKLLINKDHIGYLNKRR